MNKKSVTITQCDNGFQLFVETNTGAFLSNMYIANVIEKDKYDYSTNSVSITEILKQLFPESVGT